MYEGVSLLVIVNVGIYRVGL